ncbi:hypothetical protein BESB_049880 [Besnoitia besnoiti]|uniref:DUF6832 domain-containing protein n=1 Tax=Besnoitia besnoiti TaxID=94643 RepID=A0A2A9MLA6_BESBE|nr:hypothetical protein BESB_049880 [Besnoitia besnoiti]PFH36796.1 hypothetical protein BESB_049880 [Besnoitia besnoiti]
MLVTHVPRRARLQSVAPSKTRRGFLSSSSSSLLSPLSPSLPSSSSADGGRPARPLLRLSAPSSSVALSASSVPSPFSSLSSPSSLSSFSLPGGKEVRRFIGVMASLSSGQMTTREYEEAFLPRRLKRIKVFSSPPPSELPAHFHKRLDHAYSNPRSILKLYRQYMRKDDQPAYDWLVRCFCQLGNTFGFNSFWATKDKQVIHALPSFKFLVYDLIERKHLIQPQQVPRLLYALACLEYRSWHLLPTLLEHVEANLQKWRTPTLANLALTLSLMGVGDDKPDTNQFGPPDLLSRDYSGLVSKIALEVHRRLASVSEADSSSPSSASEFLEEPRKSPLHDAFGCVPFDYAGLAFALTLQGSYDVHLPSQDETSSSSLALFLQRACQPLSLEQLESSGWIQFFLYQVLYCVDVERPARETEIKKAVPFPFQRQLHLSWLDKILINAQPQGSEMLQLDVDAALKRLFVSDALINCSAGRPWDEQHCWFAGHLIRSRKLALEYDYLLPLGPGRPKMSGWLACKRRIFKAFGLNVATIHRCFWSLLSLEQKDVQLTRLLAQFPPVLEAVKDEKPAYEEDKNLRFKRHARQKFESWPPEKIEI